MIDNYKERKDKITLEATAADVVMASIPQYDPGTGEQLPDAITPIYLGPLEDAVKVQMDACDAATKRLADLKALFKDANAVAVAYTPPKDEEGVI